MICEDAEIVGYEHLIPPMTCRPKDRHLLAAAVRGGASGLLTSNLKDCPAFPVEPHDIEILDPDRFLLDQFDRAPRTIAEELQRQAAANRRDPKTLRTSDPTDDLICEDAEIVGLAGLLDTLARVGAPAFADEIRRHA